MNQNSVSRVFEALAMVLFTHVRVLSQLPCAQIPTNIFWAFYLVIMMDLIYMYR
jgi:hypothetical protein